MKTRLHNAQGSALLMALMSVFILSLVAATIVSHVMSGQRITYQSMAWQDSLRVAEGGVDMAMAEIRKSVSDPTAAWSGWANSSSSGAITPQAEALSKTSSVLVRTGIGGNHSWAVVRVDAPAFLVDASGDQWYRIRSTGYSEISTRTVAVGTKADVKLRKIDLLVDHRTGAVLTSPRVARVIEVIARPVGMFSNALLSDGSMSMNNHNIVVDSYDSRDPNKSTNGFYDPAKRQQNGHIATNGQLIDAGSAQIYGNAQTNGGTVLNASNVTGQIVDNFFQDLPVVVQPTSAPEPSSPVTISGTTVLTASASTTTYILNDIQLSGQSTLTITGSSDGTPTYTQIIVKNDIQLSGQAQIILGPNVFVRLFLQGNASISGNGISNPNNPRNFQFYGMQPVQNVSKSISISGNGGFRGSLYAPGHDITMTGGGNSDSIYGSLVGKSVSMTGIQSVHYDEALADGGLIADYRIASWYEDTR